jgi:hypothetical protein
MIIIVGDPHMTDKPIERYRHDFMGGWLVNHARKVKPDGIVILGDLTEEKDRHSAGLVNAVAEHLDELASIAPTLTLMGNHDYATEDVPFFDFVRRIPSIDFIRHPTYGHDLAPKFAKVFSGLLFLPHTRDHKRDWAGLDFDDVDMVLAHNTFEGANSEHGHRLSGIPEAALEGAPTLAGDVHTPQTVGGVTYLGAPYTIDFGDAYKARIAHYDRGKLKYIPVDGLPQKRLVTLPANAELLDHKQEFGPGDIIRVRIPVDNMDGWRERCAGVREDAAELEVSVERIEPIIEAKAQRKRTKVGGDARASTDKEILVQYADRHRLDDATFDIGLDLLEG